MSSYQLDPETITFSTDAVFADDCCDCDPYDNIEEVLEVFDEYAERMLENFIRGYGVES